MLVLLVVVQRVDSGHVLFLSVVVRLQAGLDALVVAAVLDAFDKHAVLRGQAMQELIEHLTL